MRQICLQSCKASGKAACLLHLHHLLDAINRNTHKRAVRLRPAEHASSSAHLQTHKDSRSKHCRKPSLLVHIRDESPGPASNVEGDELTSGEVSETIMQSLLEQGRLRLDQLISSVAHKLDRPLEQSRDLLQRHFFGLVQAGSSRQCCACIITNMPAPYGRTLVGSGQETPVE